MGARPPFPLFWHDAAVARAHLGAGLDRLLGLLAENRIEVDPR